MLCIMHKKMAKISTKFLMYQYQFLKKKLAFMRRLRYNEKA